MNEATIKGVLMTALRQTLLRYIVIRHEDKSGYGIPDSSITGDGKTSWWEFKFANPDFKSHGAQELMMKRLSNVGIAHYVIFQLKGKERWTILIKGSDLANWDKNEYQLAKVEGFNYEFVVAFVKELHSDDHVRP